MIVPEAGREIQIHSYKHNGKLHRIWENCFVLQGAQNMFVVANDKTKVIESDGRSWITKEPAICFFYPDFWFNIIGMIRTNGIHYYCNIASPFIYENRAIKYIDYDLDARVYPDMTFTILDEDEYDEHKRQMDYPNVIDAILHKQLDILTGWIRQRQGPFFPGVVDGWYERYLTYR